MSTISPAHPPYAANQSYSNDDAREPENVQHGKSDGPATVSMQGDIELVEEYDGEQRPHANSFDSETDPHALESHVVASNAATMSTEEGPDALLQSFVMIPDGSDVASASAKNPLVTDAQAKGQTLDETFPDDTAFHDAKEGPTLDDAFERLREAIHTPPEPSGLWALGNGAANLLGAVYHAGSTTAGAAVNAVTTLTSYAASGVASAALLVTGPATPPRCEQNWARAQQLAFDIRRQLNELNQSLAEIEGVEPEPLKGGHLDAPKLSGWQEIQRYHSQAIGLYKGVLGAVPQAAGGAVLAGVGFMGFGVLAVGPALIAMTAGAVLGLRSLLSIPANANRQAAVTHIEKLLPEINANIAELAHILSEENRRQQIGERLRVNLCMRRDQCVAMLQALQAADKAVNGVRTPDEMHDPVANPEPIVPLATLQSEETMRGEGLTAVVKARQALQQLVTLLTQAFKTLDSWLRAPSTWLAQTRSDRTQQRAEATFREEFKHTLHALANVEAAASEVTAQALRNLKAADPVTLVTKSGLRTDILIGQTLTHSILSSELGFGSVRYTDKAGTREEHHAVPSNLMTARAIARYIDAQALVNAQPAKAAPTSVKQAAAMAIASSVSKDPDGSYTIADPSGKLYTFLACAPTAYANLLAQRDGLSPAALMHAPVGRMTISDYSAALPGGVRHMEFEPQLDQNGAQVLKLRFVAASHSPARPEVGAERSFLDQYQDKLVSGQTPPISSDLSDMSQSQLRQHIQELESACAAQYALWKDEEARIVALSNWRNPLSEEKIQIGSF